MTENLDRYRKQLRRFLELSGVEIARDGAMRCINPAHTDEHAGSAHCYEERVTCFVPSCEASWDIFDACGLVKGIPNTKGTFRERLRIVKETLGDYSGGVGDNTKAERIGERVRPRAGSNPASPVFVSLSIADARREYGKAKKWMLQTAERLGWGDRIAGTWACKDAEGRVELLAVRFEGGEKAKNVLTFWWDGKKVQCKAPPVRLFGRDLLTASPELPVAVHFGEKCWEAAKTIPGYVPVTWNGGEKKGKMVDFSPLAGREVVVYPDDDEPGLKTAAFLAGALQGIAASVRVVRPLPEARKVKPRSADIVEALQVRSPEEMAEYLRSGPEAEFPPERPAAGQPSPDGDLPFRILGRADDGQAYFIGYQGNLEALRMGSGITKEQLFLLADMSWWEAEFHGGRSRIDMDSAKFFLIHESNGKSFSVGDLRGRGAWRESDGRLCYHDGERTYGDTDPGKIYQKKARVDMGLDGTPASASLRESMLQAASQLSFETQADCARLLAWSLLAPFCGALPWRPAGFLTGVSKSGKSTILSMVVTRLARPLFISGDSTAAFVRQETGNDCLPVVIDEAESQTDSEHRRMTDIFALMRQSTSDDAPRIGKGSMSGRSISYMTRNMYLFSAISPGMEKQADANRMFVVDLKRPENDWHPIQESLERAFTEANCRAVRAFTWSCLPEIVKRTRHIARLIERECGMSSRDALQEAILWSAHWRVWRDRFPEDEELREWLAKLYQLKAVEQPDDDAVVLLDRLLAEVAQLQDSPGRRYTVQHMALALATGMEAQGEVVGPDVIPGVPLPGDDADRYRRTLNLYGLHVPTRGQHSGCLTVALRHPWVARVLGATMGYAKVLGRHPLCTHRSEVVTPTGETSRKCMIFSRGVLEGEPLI